MNWLMRLIEFYTSSSKVDINLPFCQGCIFSIEDSREDWVSFNYEHLPNICYWCRRLNHVDRDYDLWIESDGTLEAGDQEYGSWIHAPFALLHKKPMVVVLVFYAAEKKAS